FIPNQDSAYFQSQLFSGILKFVQQHARSCKMKEDKGKLSLTLTPVSSIAEAERQLALMLGS
ncbi:MAG: hypothetical protein ACK55I_26215, partial [bacterium]